MTVGVSNMRSEEHLLPLIRSRLAEKLLQEGFRIKEIAAALNVTQAAVTQYLKRKRGANLQNLTNLDRLIDPLAEKLVRRIRSGLGGIKAAELLEASHQIMSMNMEREGAWTKPEESDRNESLELLRERLQLELTTAEKYLEMANTTEDYQTKLLLRMIATDSIRRSDVVSQMASWLEAGSESEFKMPSETLLENMLSVEDHAKEASLRDSIKVNHPVARLLLEWIDMDEGKHGEIVTRMLNLSKQR